MLSRESRIRSEKEFKKIFRFGKRFDTENFSFLVLKNEKGGRVKVGVVVSNKIDKRATRRNGIKRRIRAIVREHMNKITSGEQIVIRAKKALDYPYDFKKIEKEIMLLIDKIK